MVVVIRTMIDDDDALWLVRAHVEASFTRALAPCVMLKRNCMALQRCRHMLNYSFLALGKEFKGY